MNAQSEEQTVDSCKFIHLHVHSEYSLVDSTIRIDALVAAARAAGMPAVAVTDHNNLFALVKFYQAARRAGIKPIIGVDLCLGMAKSKTETVTLLCQNMDGYRVISRLLSRAYLDNQQQGTALADCESLLAENQGLLLLAGHSSPLGTLLAKGRTERAAAWLARYSDAFGDRLYVQLTRTSRAREERFNDAAVALCSRLDIPVVASNEVCFLSPGEFAAHEARVCIHEGRVLDDPRRPRDYAEQQYFRHSGEMCELFSDLPSALANSVEIAKRCNLELQLGKYFLPEFPVPKGETVESVLRKEARKGLASRLQEHGLAEGHDRQQYEARLEYELQVICEMGFPGYFLIVADFILWARQNDIPVGPGRGSGAGSAVAWGLGITDLDPLRYDLLFERFLNPERVSMPDFDVDFCMDKRDRVIDYVAEKYGRDRVCQIITYGSMAAKAVVRDCGRVLGLPYGMVDGVAKLIPPDLNMTLDKALEPGQALKDLYDSDEEARTLLDLARQLEGLKRNAGKHAGGVVIAPSPLTDFSPLYREPGGDSVVTQFDKNDVEAAGLVKFDFLGLRTLTIIDWAVKFINDSATHPDGQPLRIDRIPMADEKTMALLRSGKTAAVFQLESAGMKEWLVRLKPERFEDIISLLALYRPGPLESGMVGDFVDRRHGRAVVKYPHPDLEVVLKPTYGVILYQEQVMQIAQVLAGYTLGGADLLRRAMGKKKPEEMAKQRVVFVQGAVARGLTAQLADSIFDLMATFAGYGFNKSHSAAYAVVAWQTAYLKAHYPAAFMAAVLSADMDNTDKVVGLIEEVNALHLELAPAHVNASNYRFAMADESHIRYGLGAIKGLGHGAADAIVASRETQGPFTSLLDFCIRVDARKVNRRVVEILIRSGAMDGLEGNRATLMHNLPAAIKAAEQQNHDVLAGQSDLFASGQASVARFVPETVEDWPDELRLSGERDTLGLYLSGHPFDAVAEEFTALVSARLGAIDASMVPAGADQGSRRQRRNERPFTAAGLVMHTRRRGSDMVFATLDDGTGRLEVALFRNACSDYAHLLNVDQILVIEGGLSADDYSGGFRLVARRVFTLDEARARLSRRLDLSADAGQLDVAGLHKLLQDYPGERPVCLSLQGAKYATRMKLDQACQVTPSAELLHKLAKLQGITGVRVCYQRQS